MLFRCHDGYVKKGLMEIKNIKETEKHQPACLAKSYFGRSMTD